MRYILIIGFLVFLSSCYTQTKEKVHKFGQFRYYQNDTIQARLKEIVRTDSIKKPDICYLIFNSFDKHEMLVAELKYYQCQNNTKNRYLTRNIYNKFGKIIIYELFNMEGLEIERYKFDYNDKGQLIQKEGFGSGEMGILIKYYYLSTGEMIDKKAFRFGKEEKDYFKTMK